MRRTGIRKRRVVGGAFVKGIFLEPADNIGPVASRICLPVYPSAVYPYIWGRSVHGWRFNLGGRRGVLNNLYAGIDTRQ